MNEEDIKKILDEIKNMNVEQLESAKKDVGELLKKNRLFDWR